MKNMYKPKKLSMIAGIIAIIVIFTTSCSMSYTSKKLSEKSTSNSWDVIFTNLNGDLAHTINRKDNLPSFIKIDSSVQSGSLTLQIQLIDRIEEIPVGKNEQIDLSS